MILRRRAVVALILCFAVVAAAACQGRSNATRSSPPAHPAVTVSSPAESTKSNSALLDDLTILAVLKLPDGDLLAEKARVLEGQESVAAYVEALLARPTFRGIVVPRVILKRAKLYAADVGEGSVTRVLKTQVSASGGEVLYLPDHPCEVAVAERVHPWWAPQTEVLVCPDAHRPDRLKDPRGFFCGGKNLDAYFNPEGAKFCGCGPNLVNCARDDVQARQLIRSRLAEVDDTIAYVVANDLPFEQAFTMNESVRDSYAEVLYQRARAMTGEPPSFPWRDVAEALPELSPRHEETPGRHAGILTTQLAFFPDSPRARLRDFYDVLWCQEPESVNVTADQVFALGATNLREGDGWRKLASMPVCTSCHARLDYGMQFFSGFLSDYVGALYDPRQHAAGSGPLYGRDIHDAIGEAPLSPHGFAEIAVKQPAFANCMVKDVSAYVFRGTGSQEDEAAMRDAFATGHRFKDVMRAALMRYADLGGASHATSVAPSSSLRAELETSCGECHAQGPHDFLHQDQLSHTLLVAMLDEVGFRRMPPARLLDAGTRNEIVRSLAEAAFPDPTARAEALSFYRDETRALPLRPGRTVQRIIHQRAGMGVALEHGRSAWDNLDHETEGAFDYSPAAMTLVASEAVKACKRQGHVGDDLRACVDAATAPEGIVAGFARAR